MAWRWFLAVVVGAWLPAGLAAQPGPIHPLTEGTLPILPCPDDPGQGCVEILFDGDSAPVLCSTLPPFGLSGVRATLAPPQPVGGTTTRRATILFRPLADLPPSVPATLHLGIPRSGAALACDRTLVVQRPASLLALPSELDLGVLQVGLLGAVSGTPLIQPVFPAAGQPAIGPLALSGGTTLHAVGRQGSPVPVRLTMAGADRVTASRFGEVALRAGPAGAFPALGALSGQVWITAPQLVQPFALTLRASSRIDWLTILAALSVGIAAGVVVHRHIQPRQALAHARLEAERALMAAARLRDAQRDGALARDLDRLIAGQRALIGAAADQGDIARAVADLGAATAARLAEADAQRDRIAARIAPARAALSGLPPRSELPGPPLEAWSAALDRIHALLDAGEIARPDGLLTTQLDPAEAGARDALSDCADDARAALRVCDRWTRDGARQAFAPIAAAGQGFLTPPDATAPALLAGLTRTHHALRAAAAIGHGPVAAVLRGLAQGAANAGLHDAPARTEAILTDLDRTPLAALHDLQGLIADYDRQARARTLAGFEDLADILPSGLESGLLPPPAPAPLPTPPEPLALVVTTDPHVPVAGRDLTIRLADLPHGCTALIWTPQAEGRIRRATEGLTITPAHPGPLPLRIELHDAAGRALSHQTVTLVVHPAPDHAIPALAADLRRADRLALGAAAVLALLSGAAVFSVVPLTSWWGLLAPLLWGFFVNLNLPEVLAGLQARRDAALRSLNIG